MTIRTEDAAGMHTVERVTCYGGDDLADRRAHYRSIAPRGCTQTITVKGCTR